MPFPSQRHRPTLTPQSTQDISVPIEPSRDFLQLPSGRTSSDTVFTWEIFEGKYPSNALIGVLFEPDYSSFSEGHAAPSALSPGIDSFVTTTGLTPPEDERIPALVDNFLQNVHTKNPILDVETLVKQARHCAHNSPGWDGWSCLVLLACALGSVAKPFDTAAPLPPDIRPEASELANAPPPVSARLWSRDLQQAESCFVLACRRLGCLKHTLIGAQCQFFAGGKFLIPLRRALLNRTVYLMYTLRPILAWQYFFHSSILYQLYLKTTHGIMPSGSDIFQVPTSHLNMMGRKTRRLEQSLYWSCFKSECEFRVELPMPQSEIGTWEYPNLFPSPPSPPATDHVDSTASLSMSAVPGGDLMLARYDTHSSVGDDDAELRQHAKKLCNEEESWYYYLTEIALRRIGNRIVNTFFRLDHSSWLNIKPLLRTAQEFEAQVCFRTANAILTNTCRSPPGLHTYRGS